MCMSVNLFSLNRDTLGAVPLLWLVLAIRFLWDLGASNLFAGIIFSCFVFRNSTTSMVLSWFLERLMELSSYSRRLLLYWLMCELIVCIDLTSTAPEFMAVGSGLFNFPDYLNSALYDCLSDSRSLTESFVMLAASLLYGTFFYVSDFYTAGDDRE